MPVEAKLPLYATRLQSCTHTVPPSCVSSTCTSGNLARCRLGNGNGRSREGREEICLLSKYAQQIWVELCMPSKSVRMQVL